MASVGGELSRRHCARLLISIIHPAPQTGARSPPSGGGSRSREQRSDEAEVTRGRQDQHSSEVRPTLEAAPFR